MNQKREFSSVNHDWDLTIKASSDQVVIARLLKGKKGKESWFFSACTSGMLLAIVGFESFLNSFGYEAFGRDIEEIKDRKECHLLSMESKCQYIFEHYKKNLDKGSRPYQTLKEAVRWRNNAAHAKPIVVEKTIVNASDDVRKLPKKYISRQRYDSYVSKVSLENADKFNRDIIELINDIEDFSGIKPRAQCSYKIL